MTLSYEIDDNFKKLAPVLDEYAEWFGRLTRRVFYPEQLADENVLAPPESYKFWLSSVQSGDRIAPPVLEILNRIHRELHQSATALLAVSSVRGKPDVKIFDSFLTLYESFVLNLHRLELDCLRADSGVDAASGLRSQKAMTKDLEREMERRSRRGQPLCLALARIDDYEKIRTSVDEKRMGEITAAVGQAIRQCVRSFDDAYRSGDSEFVMSFKNSDKAGGSAALLRLRSLLEAAHIVVKDKTGGEFVVTMSSCVAEPLPGDTIDDMIRNMRADIDKYDKGGNTSLEYFEQSPLQRFVKEME